MVWPNVSRWKALAAGERIEAEGGHYVLSVVDCGELVMPTGHLVACAPFTSLDAAIGPYLFLRFAPGRYPVKVTLADVGGKGDGRHLREACATPIPGTALEVERRAAVPLRDGGDTPELGPGAFAGFGGDAGTPCFVDGGAPAAV